VPAPQTGTFRAVKKMTEPFPLVLPDSPIESDDGSDCSKSPTVAIELRRRSPTYNDLRSLAAKHKDVVARRAEALLPSPIIKDNNDHSNSYVNFHNPRRRQPAVYRSYEDLHILSEYCDTHSTADVQRGLDIGYSIPGSISEDSLVREGDDNKSISSDEGPATPHDQLGRTETYCSDESGWLANQTSCVEREKKFKARCVQIVQCPDQETDTRCAQIVSTLFIVVRL
jgi:hypothetical protein